MSELKPIIEQSFSQYAGAVLQSRALVDVRDCIKPSARQIFYSMLLNKLTAENKFKKTANAVGLAMADFYIHGDSSCEGVIMRAAQPFSMRYPLVSVKGNCGSLIASGNWAAPRYTESKLSEMSNLLFKDVNKKAIFEWRDNYDNTKQYPAVLPSKGFYNIVNGTMGIGVGAASSIPQFNLKDVNNALITLLWKPDCSFEEIYCCPDFATGALLLNESEVKESLKLGKGKSCKLRSVVKFDEKERCLVVTQIPYGVYTNTICGELDKILDSDSNCGIDRYNDLTNKESLIKIYLTKRAQPDKIIKYLYKNTSLQSYYGINFTMLDKGRYPRVFTWKEALQAYLDHEVEVYTNVFKFDLKKITDRLHILDGLVIALANIDEVVAIIKGSASSAAASIALQSKFNLSEAQAKAILDMKLSRLAKLEVTKLEKEISDLKIEKERIEKILNDDTLLKKEIEKDLIAVRDKYGDARRTQVMNLSSDNEDEIIEEITLIAHITNKGNIYTSQSSTLYAQRRGGKGNKIKLDDDEYIIATINSSNFNSIFITTDKGKVYNLNLRDVSSEGVTSIYNILNFDSTEQIIGAMSYNKTDNYKYVIFLTKLGMIKKTLISEYKTKRSTGIQGIKLKPNDEIVDISFINDENYLISTHEGYGIRIDTKEIMTTGRVTQGVIGIKLGKEDYVVSGIKLPINREYIVTVTENGFVKKTDISEYILCNRYTKGSLVHKIDDNDFLAATLPLTKENKDIILIGKKKCIKFSTNEINLSSRVTKGTHSMKLSDNEKIKNLVCSIE